MTPHNAVEAAVLKQEDLVNQKQAPILSWPCFPTCNPR